MLKHDERRAWLWMPGSLTKQLRRACVGALHVDVQTEGWVRAEPMVARALALPLGMWVWRREVVLRCDAEPYVHAVSFTGRAGVVRLGLQRLGRRPLGEVLFRRGSSCVARGVVRRFAAQPSCGSWRRWSVFRAQGHAVLLFEDFMTALPSLRR